MSAIVSRIAHELGVREAQVQAAVDLLDQLGRSLFGSDWALGR